MHVDTRSANKLFGHAMGHDMYRVATFEKMSRYLEISAIHPSILNQATRYDEIGVHLLAVSMIAPQRSSPVATPGPRVKVFI